MSVLGSQVFGQALMDSCTVPNSLLPLGGQRSAPPPHTCSLALPPHVAQLTGKLPPGIWFTVFSILYYIVLYFTVLYGTLLYCTVLYCDLLYCTVLYCTVLYCTVLYYIVLYFTVLYCTKKREFQLTEHL